MEVMRPRGSYLTPSFDHATVGDAMRPRVLTCDPSTPLATVAEEMATEHVHSIVVIADGDDGERAWGVVTDRDVLGSASRVEELTAADAMGGRMLDAFPGERLADVAARMVARERATCWWSTSTEAAPSASSRRSTSPGSWPGAGADGTVTAPGELAARIESGLRAAAVPGTSRAGAALPQELARALRRHRPRDAPRRARRVAPRGRTRSRRAARDRTSLWARPVHECRAAASNCSRSASTPCSRRTSRCSSV